ncbi:MAG: acyl carrier protein [Bacteroidota bacterium]
METTIIEYIRREFHGDKKNLVIQPEDDLLSSNLISSMDMIRLISFLEETFEHKIPPQDMTIDNFITVAAMRDYLQAAKA